MTPDPQPTPPAPSPRKQTEAQAQVEPGTTNATDTLRTPAGSQAVVTQQDTLKPEQRLAQRFGAFAGSAQGSARTIHVRTGELELDLNTLGASLKPVLLRNFRTHDSLPLPVQPQAPGSFYSLEFTHNRQTVDTRDLYFITDAPPVLEVKPGEKKTLTLRAYAGEGKYLEQQYTFYGEGYHVDHQVRMVNLGDLLTDKLYYVHARLEVPPTEMSTQKMFPTINIFYNYQDELESLDATEKDPQEKIEQGNVRWVAFKSQFFSQVMMANTHYEYVKLQMTKGGKNKAVKTLEAYMQVPYSQREVDTAGFRLYFGPNDYYVLRKYDLKLEKMLDLGWGPIKLVNAYIILPVFKFLEKVTPNYGIIIFLLALLIKLITLPLTWKSHLSMVKMQVVNKMPEIKALDEKYKDDPQRLQTEKMSFYMTAGVNPLGGCLPLLLQLPVLLAMFSFFPASIELRQQAFLWAHDLSTYDSIWTFGYVPIIHSIYGDHVSLFTLLMTISTLVYTYISQQGQTNAPAQFKYLGYIMPLVFLGILNNYSAGLSYYYLVANLLTIAQTFLMRAFVNEEKIHAQIHAKRKEKAAKGGGKAKKGGLAGWLETQQRKQQELIRERNAANKGGKR